RCRGSAGRRRGAVRRCARGCRGDARCRRVVVRRVVVWSPAGAREPAAWVGAGLGGVRPRRGGWAGGAGRGGGGAGGGGGGGRGGCGVGRGGQRDEQQCGGGDQRGDGFLEEAEAG